MGPEGTDSTFQFIKKKYSKEAEFTYAEFGVYEGSTALKIAKDFPNSTIFLFDYEITLLRVREKFSLFGDRIQFHGNSHKFLDNYNWSLSEILKINPSLKFDYVFIDGAHTFAIDALTFFLCDRMLNYGGYIDFDDYDWKLRGSSLDPHKVPETGHQYTDEQIDDLQIKRVIELLVKTDSEYQEIEENKIFQKTNLRVAPLDLSSETTMSEGELAFLTKFLSKSANYLEYGSGFSTLLAANLVSKRIVSIETSKEYRDFMISEMPLNRKSTSFEIIHTDIGQTGLWGYPVNDLESEKWANYFNWRLQELSDFSPDTVLVDGRFRVATFADVFLRFPGATVLFDDYFDRPNYSIVEKILKPRNRCGRIAEFRIPKIRGNKTIQKCLELHKMHMHDPQ